jgi:hypothetical protein
VGDPQECTESDGTDAPEVEVVRQLGTEDVAATVAVEPGPIAAGLPKVVVPRWIQLVALPLLVLGLWAVARAAGPVLLIFAIAGILALILDPLVRLI